MKKTCGVLSSFKGFFTYSTIKEAKTNNFKISLVYRIIQIPIIYYVFFYDIFKNKSYQLKDNGISTVVIKVTGTGYTHEEETILRNEYYRYRIFDTSGIILHETLKG